MSKSDFTVSRLKEVLHYDPETGHFAWKIMLSKRMKIGSRAGTVSDRGYLKIAIDGVLYRAHRLAWLYTYGAWPSKEIDHINRIRLDNRIENLRDVPSEINQRNRTISMKNNRNRMTGVTATSNGRFQANIKISGKRICLGTFDAEEKAHQAYVFARAESNPADQL